MVYPEQQQPVLANAGYTDTLFTAATTPPPQIELSTPENPHQHNVSFGRRIAGIALGIAVASGIMNMAEADPAAASSHHNSTSAHQRMLRAASTKLIAAHRGDLNGLDRPSSHYAENTIPNDLSAVRFFKHEHKQHPELQLKNFFIEGDIQFTKDGKAVWFHDSTLDRITNCSGPIARKTTAQLGRCVINIAEVHSHIPSFSQVVKEVASSGVSLMPELKAAHTTLAEEQDVATTLEHYGMDNDRTIMQSFHTALLKQWNTVAPNVPAAQLQYSLHNPSGVSKYARYVLLDEAHTSNADIRQATQAGLAVGLWTVDSENKQRSALRNPDVKVLISNTLRRAL